MVDDPEKPSPLEEAVDHLAEHGTVTTQSGNNGGPPKKPPVVGDPEG